MYTFYDLGNLGRLGNQMFQYAALRSLGTKNNVDIKIPNISGKSWHGQECLLGNFNLQCDYIEDKDIQSIKYRYIEPDHMKYDNRFFEIPDNTDIHGFFQSTFYFNNCKNIITKEFTPKEHFIEISRSKIRKIKEKLPQDYDIVSLHLRRGDNTDGSNPNQELNSMYGNKTINFENSMYGIYLKKAKQEFKNKKVKFLVFSGGSRTDGNSNLTDLEWCRKTLIGEEYLFLEEPSDTMEDFCLLMEADHSIISHVSSFGWWASYIGKRRNPEKMVICPKNYHPDMPNYTYREGFYPNKWSVI